MMTGPGTNTYLVGRDQLAVIDPGPDDARHLDAVATAGAGRIRWILVTHTHPDHAPGAARLAAWTGAERVGSASRDGFTADRAVGDGWQLARTRPPAPGGGHTPATPPTTSASCSTGRPPTGGARPGCSSPATTSCTARRW